MRFKLSLLSALLLTQASPGPAAALPASSATTEPHSASAIAASATPKFLEGSASVSHSAWQQHYDSGIVALDRRQFDLAQKRLTAALAELRKRNINDVQTLQTKNALAAAYLEKEKYDGAQRLFSDVISRAPALGKPEQQAKALLGLAQTFLAQEKFDQAEQTAKQALQVQLSVYSPEDASIGKTYDVLGRVYASKNLDEKSLESSKKAIAILEKNPGFGKHDLTEALLSSALVNKIADNDDISDEQFKRAYELIDKQAHFDKPLATSNRLTVRWHEGTPRSRKVADAEYPLRYVFINGLRIAAVPVRSENVIGVIISFANCSQQRQELALGDVSMDQLAPKHKPFDYVSPRALDMELEANHLVELTWRRRWLNHIQKTRRIPGYLKDGILDVDNFLGNNQFGYYGQWATLARPDPPIVTREMFYYNKLDNKQLQNDNTANFLSYGHGNVQKTYLEPGDAKTGLVFFRRERFDRAKLDIVVGNTIVQIPFDSAGPRLRE